MSSKWLGDVELAGWIGYRRLRVRLDAEVARDLERDSGLSMADYDVLTALDGDDEGMRLKVLADALFWSQSRLSRQLLRMERRGLVERFRDEADGRGVSARLMKAGHRALVAAAPDHVSSVRRHFVDLLDGQQLQSIAEVSRVVCEHLDAIGAPRALDAD